MQRSTSFIKIDRYDFNFPCFRSTHNPLPIGFLSTSSISNITETFNKLRKSFHYHLLYKKEEFSLDTLTLRGYMNLSYFLLSKELSCTLNGSQILWFLKKKAHTNDLSSIFFFLIIILKFVITFIYFFSKYEIKKTPLRNALCYWIKYTPSKLIYS